MRARGCLLPAAFLFVIGWFFLLAGLMGNSSQATWAGAAFLAAAVVVCLVALFFRWQGWGD